MHFNLKNKERNLWHLFEKYFYSFVDLSLVEIKSENQSFLSAHTVIFIHFRIELGMVSAIRCSGVRGEVEEWER